MKTWWLFGVGIIMTGAILYFALPNDGGRRSGHQESQTTDRQKIVMPSKSKSAGIEVDDKAPRDLGTTSAGHYTENDPHSAEAYQRKMAQRSQAIREALAKRARSKKN